MTAWAGQTIVARAQANRCAVLRVKPYSPPALLADIDALLKNEPVPSVDPRLMST